MLHTIRQSPYMPHSTGQRLHMPLSKRPMPANQNICPGNHKGLVKTYGRSLIPVASPHNISMSAVPTYNLLYSQVPLHSGHAKLHINSLSPGRCGNDFKSIIFNFIIQSSSHGTHCEIALMRMPQKLTNE